MKTKLFLLSLFGALLAHAQTLHFQKLAHMSAGRGAAASVIVNDNIYVSNGYTEKEMTVLLKNIILRITAGVFSIPP